jgi:hypothetical protein
MRTHRFGRKIKLPATIAIKHEVRMRMAQYEVKKAEAEARAEGRQDGMVNALIVQVGAPPMVPPKLRETKEQDE